MIDDEIRNKTLDYTRWFPRGNLAAEFNPSPSEGVKRSTLASIFNDWSKKNSPRVSANWLAVRRSYLSSHVVPVLGRIFLDRLEQKHLLDLKDSLLQKSLSPATVDRVIHSALRGMLRDAEIQGYRVVDPSTLFKTRNLKRLDKVSTPRIDSYSDDERDRILGWFVTHRRHCYPFVCFRFWTGTRPSEAVALRWGAVDLDHNRLYIQEGRVMGRSGRTKTGYSKREVLVHDELVEILRTLKPSGAGPNDYVFVGPRGKPIGQDNFHRRNCVPGCRRSVFAYGRHMRRATTYFSYVLAAGAQPLFVARQTGTSLKMIENHNGNHRITPSDVGALIRSGEHEDVAQLSLRRRRIPSGGGAHGRNSAVGCE